MKKLLIIAGVIVVIFGLIIFLNNQGNEAKLKDNPYGTNDLKQSTIDLLSDKNYQNIITLTELEKKLSKGDPTVVYFFSPECTHCRAATPKLMPLAKKLGVHIDQLNLLEYDLDDKYGVTATPTLSYYKDGKEIQRMEGDADEATFEAFLKQTGLVK
ncbi:thioredoxin family protein [Viridibacillus sp. FSL E2-0187]|uniref:thioredoxin family protein n=1 Tax=Viridibacillus TaxID=496496 RepID=UPI00187B4088|nr:thioredoxin family protein [Viridibacillus sp. JNUCC-6]QOV09313.1 thioredoxin family protein [Viridibacillus sp. JNUCC-6]